MSTEIQKMHNYESIEKFREACQNFINRMNFEPKPESLGATPDGKASTVNISHIEMTLDEFFFGLWSTKNFKWEVIANEVVGSIDLEVLHPVSAHWITRSGAAAITIMVDKAPIGVDRNSWALNVNNKKPNALYMGFPKLKAECLKNAANSLGKMFGRDLNRKNVDYFNPVQKQKFTPNATNSTTGQ